MNLKISQKNLPPAPGVYIFRDREKRVLYVGKAKNLRKRVASYFRKFDALAPDKKLMVPKIKSIKHIIVDNETEALLLEHNLIKKYRPCYNVVLKDDRSLSYIVITAEDYPRIYLARGRTIEKTPRPCQKKIFGPYLSGDAARETLDHLRQIFPFRSCEKLPNRQGLSMTGGPHRACLYHHIKLCPAPCLQKISLKDYQETVREIIYFLKGQTNDIVKSARQKMEKASHAKKYEEAARYRDRLRAFAKIKANQKVISSRQTHQDIVSVVRKDNQAAINLFQIREGRLLDKKNFLLVHTRGKTTREILESFLEEYYLTYADQPRELILPASIAAGLLPQIKIVVPQKGRQRKLIQMGETNAASYLQNLQKQKKPMERKNQASSELASYLRLKKIPRRIEAYDISNIQGQAATGSMVVFQNGRADKSAYRRFKIKTVKGANDVAMIAEVLHRRLKHKEWFLPDLMMMDGGKAQLNVAVKTIKANHLKIPVVALAKRLEEIYLPRQKNPLTLPPASQSLMLLKRIRDEAHRFAINYHHHLRSRIIPPLPRGGQGGV